MIIRYSRLILSIVDARLELFRVGRAEMKIRLLLSELNPMASCVVLYGLRCRSMVIAGIYYTYAQHTQVHGDIAYLAMRRNVRTT